MPTPALFYPLSCAAVSTSIYRSIDRSIVGRPRHGNETTRSLCVFAPNSVAIPESSVFFVSPRWFNPLSIYLYLSIYLSIHVCFALVAASRRCSNPSEVLLK